MVTIKSKLKWGARKGYQCPSLLAAASLFVWLSSVGMHRAPRVEPALSCSKRCTPHVPSTPSFLIHLLFATALGHPREPLNIQTLQTQVDLIVIPVFVKVFSRLSAPRRFALRTIPPYPSFGLAYGGFCFLRDVSSFSSEVEGILCAEESPFFVYGPLSVVLIHFDIDSRDIEQGVVYHTGPTCAL
ncbi:hypothetical protein HOY82DRAFT_61240 [Tuber indicum]|nr:hypothetical protein HOY82DRAFT_61240 [Tuber indicum]